MPSLSIELSAETVDALEVERERLGFESRRAYVRWIVANRGSIEASQDSGDEREPTSTGSEHAKRLERLENRVATLIDSLDGADETPVTPSGDDGRSTAGTRHEREGTAEISEKNEPVEEPSLEVRGSPQTIRRPQAPSDGGDETATSGHRTKATAGSNELGTRDADESDESAHSSSMKEAPDSLTPERVERISEDPVHEDAGVLETVEAERVNELSRRAVAATRVRLNRDVHTGLEYTSSTPLAKEMVRPGGDLVDLDSLSVPGREAETIEMRRRAVGRAVAYVRDEGDARRADFVESLYEGCPAGYETADSWWECIKSGLKQVEAVDGGDGVRVWRYRE
ncbi:hypothetical protein SAMN04487967_0304 [Natronorubrum sediminis]|uniref:Uncharacterized protein n=1 Tax=Natronorubrum sediminis TaxID=640943 RepID=A0A1H6FKF9_9EURY|nr:hypothetical protein [Natronorubrum sediminis]SEH11336.1 hypothetical protein SAMN04487967_0304 [Natronorubrum sediminis]